MPPENESGAQTPNIDRTPEQGYIDGLKAEREGYVARGLDDRVAEVDAELKRAKAAARGRRTAADTTPTQQA